MKRNPGEWLRARLLDQVTDAALVGMAGIGMLSAAFLSWSLRSVLGQLWTDWLLCVAGAGLLTLGVYRGTRGWKRMQKGARAEEEVGQAIEWALTHHACAVAHNVMNVIPRADIDHLLATPHALWVVETKHGDVPRREFAKTLWRIAGSVKAVRDWAPDSAVVGCLVVAHPKRHRRADTYTEQGESIRFFPTAQALADALRRESRAPGGSPALARRVWELAGRSPVAG